MGIGVLSGLLEISQLIHEIRDLMVLLKVELVHIPRTKNGLEDKLAKWGVDLPSIVKSNVILDLPV